MSGNLPRNPLNYPINTPNPLNFYTFDRAPTSADFKDFIVSDFWLDRVTLILYFLSETGFQSATWQPLGSPASNLLTLTGDLGGSTGPDGLGNIDILGGTDIAVISNPFLNQLTINATGSISTVVADSGSATPALNSFEILGGLGITTFGVGDTITIDLDNPALSWILALASQTMSGNTGYVSNNAALLTLTLPPLIAFGESVEVSGLGAGGWKIEQNVGQTIHFGAVDTTTGIGGSLASTDQSDSVRLLCVVANTEFNVLSSVGNLAII